MDIHKMRETSRLPEQLVTSLEGGRFRVVDKHPA